MLKYIPDIIDAGVSSAKIEGRMKSVFYVATVVSAYRKAIDSYYDDPDNYEFNPEWFDEMMKASHREFTTGFYFDKPTNEDQNYQTSAYVRDYSFTGMVKSYDEKTGMAIVEQRNKMVVGDEIEIFGPGIEFFTQKLEILQDEEGNPLESAPHPQQILKIKMEKPVSENYIIRKKKKTFQ
ncbi:MAG: peptidase U32 family protein, partial [Anaerovoracaceae bacterium]